MGIEDEVIEAVAKQSGIDKDKLNLNSRLKEDLNMDSLDEAELAMQIEERYNITIPEGESGSLRTVNDIIKYVREYNK